MSDTRETFCTDTKEGRIASRLNKENLALKAEIERLRGALTELCDVVAEDEEHGDGAYENYCRICVVHAKCRTLLSVEVSENGRTTDG